MRARRSDGRISSLASCQIVSCQGQPLPAVGRPIFVRGRARRWPRGVCQMAREGAVEEEPRALLRGEVGDGGGVGGAAEDVRRGMEEKMGDPRVSGGVDGQDDGGPVEDLGAGEDVGRALGGGHVAEPRRGCIERGEAPGVAVS